MKFIYQIGRFDANYMSNVEFKFENETYASPLSSISLKQHFLSQGFDTKLVLIYPVSIIYNESAVERLKEKDSFVQKINENILNYLDEPRAVLESHPHNKEADDFLIIHSIGRYRLRENNEVEFKSSYDDIVLEILCDMIERYIKVKDQENEFYIDISSGHNIYVSALLEALRHFSVFSQLLNWQNKNFRPKTYIVFSDPILGSSAKEFQIYIQKVEFKAFFSSPVKKEDIDQSNGNRLSKKLYHEDREKRRKLDGFLENFGITYSAIKNNTPLVLYHFKHNQYNEILDFLTGIIREIKIKLSRDWINSAFLSKDDYLKIILSLGFYAGIVEVLESNCVKNQEKGINLNEIKEKFGSSKGSIYDIFDLNLLVPLLGQEIYTLSESKDKDGKRLIDKVSNEWEKLDKYLYGEGGNFNRRHFLAHAGFERNITQVRGEANELYFRYDSNSESDIKGCLKEYI